MFRSQITEDTAPGTSPSQKSKQTSSNSWSILPGRFSPRSRRATSFSSITSRKRSKSEAKSPSPEPFVFHQDDFPTSKHEANLIRDKDYYIDDNEGMCVFRIQDVLFRVHRFLLSRDNSAFDNMFRMPRGGGGFEPVEVEGSSDQNPVLLVGDSPEQFRSFLWALYALPPDLLKVSVEKLVDIAAIAHKYHFESIESWAVELLLNEARHHQLHSLPAEVYALILEISVLCDQGQLRDLVVEDSINRILWHGLSPEPLLVVAEKHGLRKLQGVAYYRQLTKLNQTANTSGQGISRPCFTPAQSAEQRVRLLLGYQSLVRLWDNLRCSPPTFSAPLSGTCLQHSECLETWSQKWLEASRSEEVLELSTVDLLGRLSAMDDRLRMELVFEKRITLQCTLAGFEAVSACLHKVIETMVDHFVALV